jgi:flagellar hook protein FlgE
LLIVKKSKKARIPPMSSNMQIFSSALQGLNAAETQLDQTASRISRAGSTENAAAPDSVDLSTEMVNLLTAKVQFAANLKSIEVGNQMEKHTLDILG